jgi:glucokinase
VAILNDFEAIAWSLPLLQAQDCIAVGLPPTRAFGDDDITVGVVGPGTGLGAAGLVRRSGRLFAIVGEAGHVGFAPETQLQMDVLGCLRQQFDRVSDERLVSGPGLENIYSALGILHADKPASLSAREIFSCAATNSDERASEALQLFFEILGQTAGNLALSIRALDGIYIAGGIVKRNPALLTSSRFRSGFESKGRYRSLMEQIPTQIIMHPQPGLLGAAHCALQML